MELETYEDRVTNCYASAFHDFLLGKFSDVRGWKLVHGYPLLTKADKEFPVGTMIGHAWLESGSDIEILGMAGVVFDSVHQKFFEKEAYYRAGKIDPALCRYYDFITAGDLVLKHRNYGPWETPPPEAKFAEDHNN